MKYQDTKLIVFLKTFSKEEISEFEKFLSSPYFKKVRDTLPLLKALKKFHPEFEEKKFSEEAIFNKIFPGQDYNDKNSKNSLRSLTSYLMKAVEDFIYISKLKDKKTLKNRILLGEIIDRNLTKHYEPYMEQGIEDMDTVEKISGMNNVDNYHLEKINARYFYSKMDLENYIQHVIKSIENISSQFWIDLISTAKTVIFVNDNREQKRSYDLIDKLLESADMDKVLKAHEGTKDHALISFHYLMYRHLKTKGEENNYEKAKEYFFKIKSGMSRQEKVDHYSELLNLFLLKFTIKGLDVKREMFSLIKECLKDKAYKISDTDFMHPVFYRNAVLTADYLNECDWAYEFIDKYSDELMPDTRDNLRLYYKALIDCRGGKHEESLANISKIKYDFISFKTDVKVLMLRNFYELNLFDQADSTIDTFRHYIKVSDHLDDEYKKAFGNYLIYYQKLQKLKLNDRLSAKDRSVEAGSLIKDIENEGTLAQRLWLNEKLLSILNGKL